MTSELEKDRFAGALFGLAVGDALGTTLEFKWRGSFDHHTEMVGGGPFDMPPGGWTDDTSMACCLAESIIETRSFDVHDQMDRYLRWQRDGHWSVKGYCFDIGATTSASLQRYAKTGRAFTGAHERNESANGNGSLMRLAPLPMAYRRTPGTAGRFARLSSLTTHGGQQAQDACHLWTALIIDAFTHGEVTKEHILRAATHPLGSKPYDPELVRRVRNAWGGKAPSKVLPRGYVLDGVELALSALFQTSTFEDGLIEVVNQGGDADTNGAIYGQLAGAIYGASAIPARWFKQLMWRGAIGQLIVGLWRFSEKVEVVDE